MYICTYLWDYYVGYPLLVRTVHREGVHVQMCNCTNAIATQAVHTGPRVIGGCLRCVHVHCAIAQPTAFYVSTKKYKRHFHIHGFLCKQTLQSSEMFSFRFFSEKNNQLLHVYFVVNVILRRNTESNQTTSFTQKYTKNVLLLVNDTTEENIKYKSLQVIQ